MQGPSIGSRSREMSRVNVLLLLTRSSNMDWADNDSPPPYL